MDILVASSNDHKLQELQGLLAPHKLHLPKEFGLAFECDETGSTFAENAMQKAMALNAVASDIHMSILADDSGLLVDALPGELGIHTARFGSKEGEPVLPADVKNKLLLERMKGVKNRSAKFVCTLVLITAQRIITCEATAPGYIKTEISNGTGGFGYDPVFFNTEANCCFADMGEQKNIYSHRAKAAKMLLEKIEEIPLRNEINENNKWDLSLLCKDPDDFKNGLNILENKAKSLQNFSGKISKSANNLYEMLVLSDEVNQLAERLGNYAFLNYESQTDNSDYQTMMGLYTRVSTEIAASISFIEPEILQMDNLEQIINESRFEPYKVMLSKLLRTKNHILSDKEEAILAMQSELQSTPNDAFEALTDADMDFGKINGKSLSQSTFSIFMHNPDRELRKKAYLQFYENFLKHEQTLSKLYASSVKQDIFNAKVRHFNSSLEASLFDNNVPVSVYTGLIDAVHEAFPLLHKYYSLKKDYLNLKELRHYDVYVPLAISVQSHTPYIEACNTVREALKPLGEEYTDVLYNGLTKDRWVDIYENKGKRSGAFSSGGFIGNPYILLNYKEDVLNDVFTIAHEGGHSMHSYYSKLNNHFSCYNYTIFEAEVASTFNEQLLASYLADHAENGEMKSYIISKQLDDMVATLFRQTMFAEFELICHKMQENGEILTSESIRKTYRNLLEQYFGPEMIFEECSDLECLRIPHFYNTFYVYKYATGISAAIALSEKVKTGTEKDRNQYISFLKNGGRYFPIDNLKMAGVDMSTQDPVKAAINKFKTLLNERILDQ